jgi:hypothetical protein
MLTQQEINQFIENGFVKLEYAFPEALADAAREILWRDTRCDPNDASTWTKPVVRLGYYSDEPFRKAVNTERLHAAFDQLVGKGRWLPRIDLGTFPVRFPAIDDPGDTGWHVDAGFPGEVVHDYFSWRINIHSKGRALLMLFLLSDIEETDAPTRILTSSHLDVARTLAPFGDAGLTFMELAQQLVIPDERPVALATGKAGTVYLCHPFIAHAAQPHRGVHPRFMAQPPLVLSESFAVYDKAEYTSPVEHAIRIALSL